MNSIAIIQAIQSKNCLRIFSGGEKIVEPHCLGVTTKGNLALRCWQRRGFSASGQHTAWKLILVENILHCQLANETFEPHAGYRRGDKAMQNIIAQL